MFKLAKFYVFDVYRSICVTSSFPLPGNLYAQNFFCVVMYPVHKLGLWDECAIFILFLLLNEFSVLVDCDTKGV